MLSYKISQLYIGPKEIRSTDFKYLKMYFNFSVAILLGGSSTLSSMHERPLTSFKS